MNILKKLLSFTVAILPWLFVSLMCAFSVYSIHFAVEPYDEAFYIAIPFHFIKGAQPFVDEYNLIQTAALFSYPFFKLFYSITANTEGIILYSRYLYTIFTLICAAAIFYLLRNVVIKSALLTLVTCVFIFVPFNIHGLSYNTLGMLFLTLSLLLGFYSAMQTAAFKKSEDLLTFDLVAVLFFTGLFWAFTIIAYPPFLLSGLLTGLLVWILLLPKLRFKGLGIYTLGLTIGGSGIVILLLLAGFKQIQQLVFYLFSIGTQGGGIAKLISVFKQIGTDSPPYFGLIVSVCFVVGLLQRHLFFHRYLNVLLLLITVFLLISTLGKINAAGNIFAVKYVLYLALSGLALFPWLKNSTPNHYLFYLVWVPSLFAGLISSWASSNGALNSVIGLFPAALVSLCFIANVFTQNQDVLGKKLTQLLAITTLIYTIYPLQLSNLADNYDDLPSQQLSTKMTSGPFAGLYTTPAKKAYYTQFQSDLNTYTTTNDRLFFFDDFPAGYLLANRTPTTNTLWSLSPLRYPTMNRQPTLNYFQNKNYPDVIIQITQVAENIEPTYYYRYPPTDLLQQLLQKKYTLILQRPAYKFYKLIPP